MQQALQIQTRVDQTLVDAIPALKPLLGHRVQMIALDLEPPAKSGTIGQTREDAGEGRPQDKLTLETFLSTRPVWPKDRPP